MLHDTFSIDHIARDSQFIYVKSNSYTDYYKLHAAWWVAKDAGHGAGKAGSCAYAIAFMSRRQLVDNNLISYIGKG